MDTNHTTAGSWGDREITNRVRNGSDTYELKRRAYKNNKKTLKIIKEKEMGQIDREQIKENPSNLVRSSFRILIKESGDKKL